MREKLRKIINLACCIVYLYFLHVDLSFSTALLHLDFEAVLCMLRPVTIEYVLRYIGRGPAKMYIQGTLAPLCNRHPLHADMLIRKLLLAHGAIFQYESNDFVIACG